MVGVGLIIPIIPDLLADLTGQPVNETSWFGTLLIISFAGMQFFFAPVMGEISDRYGRRRVLLLALLGLSLDYLLHGLAPSLAWLFVGRFLAGITGATHSVANAYVADISTKENKSKNFGLIGAAFGLGFVLGPIMGGLLSEIDLRMPFYVAAGLALVNCIFGFFFLPESLPKENRRKINYKKMVPGVSLKDLGEFKGVGLLLLALFFAYLAGQSLPATWSFYCKEMFSWSRTEIGISLSVVGVLVAMVQGGLVGVFNKRLGQKKTVVLGFILYTIGMTAFGFANTPLLLYLFLIPYALGGISGPTLQGIVSNQVPENQQGNLQGSITSLNSLTTIVGPLMAGGIFTIFADKSFPYYFPGAPYIAAGFFLLISTFIVKMGVDRIPDNEGDENIIDDEVIE